MTQRKLTPPLAFNCRPRLRRASLLTSFYASRICLYVGHSVAIETLKVLRKPFSSRTIRFISTRNVHFIIIIFISRQCLSTSTFTSFHLLFCSAFAVPRVFREKKLNQPARHPPTRPSLLTKPHRVPFQGHKECTIPHPIVVLPRLTIPMRSGNKPFQYSLINYSSLTLPSTLLLVLGERPR